jgi:15-cis-phytoene desaturase
MRVLVIGAGLSGLAATERLLDSGASVTVVESFPLPGGRVASFDVPVAVAGLAAGDVVEHGLHAWFQHYHELFALMERAGVSKPRFSGEGVYFWSRSEGHYVIEGGPLFWLINSLRLPERLRGNRAVALAAFGRLVAELEGALSRAEATDLESAASVLRRVGVPEQALDNVFRPCLYSLTSLRFEELSALEMLRWMSKIIPDPRIRCLRGGGTASMCAPITEHLERRGADFRFGVEVHRMALRADGGVDVHMNQAPDRTGVRHVLVPGFRPAEPPDNRPFDAVISTLPWERLRAVTRDDPSFSRLDSWPNLDQLENIHPLTIRIWFERPIGGAEEHYILSSGTIFDVLRPTREPERYPEIRLIDALVEDIDLHLPEVGYDRERLLEEGAVADLVMRRVLGDLERLYPGQVDGNPVSRKFLHTREGIVACRPGVWKKRLPQYVGSRRFTIGGDWTRQPFGVCMEGAVRSGQLAAEALLTGAQPEPKNGAFSQVAFSAMSLFQRR